MRVAVVGAGAIGGFIAALLARAGNDVSVVARGEHLAAIRRSGLRVASAGGNFAVKVPAASDLRDLGAFDAVLLTVKAHHVRDVLPQVTPSVEGGATIVPLQNGVPFWYFEDRTVESVDPHGTIRSTLPRAQIVGAVVHTSGEIAAPGVIHQSGAPTYIFGSPDRALSKRVQEIADLFREGGMQPSAVGDLRPAVWFKLLGNVSLNPVSALTRRTIKPLLEDPSIRSLIARLMEETLRVASATGVQLDVSIEERIALAARLADVKTSMLQDLEAGRPLELEPIVGAVMEIAEIFSVTIPAIRAVYALTKSLHRLSAA